MIREGTCSVAVDDNSIHVFDSHCTQLSAFPQSQQSYTQSPGAQLCTAVTQSCLHCKARTGVFQQAEGTANGKKQNPCTLTVVLSRTTSQSLRVVLLHVAFTRHWGIQQRRRSRKPPEQITPTATSTNLQRHRSQPQISCKEAETRNDHSLNYCGSGCQH